MSWLQLWCNFKRWHAWGIHLELLMFYGMIRLFRWFELCLLIMIFKVTVDVYIVYMNHYTKKKFKPTKFFQGQIRCGSKYRSYLSTLCLCGFQWNVQSDGCVLKCIYNWDEYLYMYLIYLTLFKRLVDNFLHRDAKSNNRPLNKASFWTPPSPSPNTNIPQPKCCVKTNNVTCCEHEYVNILCTFLTFITIFLSPQL